MAAGPERAPADCLPFVWPLNLVGHQRAVFCLLAVSAMLTYRLAIVAGRLDRREALSVALLSLAFPACRMWPMFATGGYVVNYTEFLAGAALGFAARQKDGAGHCLLRLGALAAFALSFDLKATR